MNFLNRKILNSQQSGRSMIEMLGVLAIVGVLSIGGIAGYSKAMQKQRINNIRNQVAHIVAGVRQFYAAQGNFDNLTTEVAIQAGIIPDDMEIGNAEGGTVSVKNVYGGDIFVEVNPDSDVPEFVVLIDGLPKDATVDVSTADWKSDSGLREIEIVNRDRE